MTADVELLPCPFCGSDSVDEMGWASTDSAGPACDDCGASAGGVVGTLQDNIAAWNRRATAAKDAEIEALRAEVETLRDGLDYLRQMQGVPDVLELRAKAARAERLAEALRVAVDSDLGALWVWPESAREQWMKDARAALEQENSDGREAVSA